MEIGGTKPRIPILALAIGQIQRFTNTLGRLLLLHSRMVRTTALKALAPRLPSRLPVDLFCQVPWMTGSGHRREARIGQVLPGALNLLGTSFRALGEIHRGCRILPKRRCPSGLRLG